MGRLTRYTREVQGPEEIQQSGPKGQRGLMSGLALITLIKSAGTRKTPTGHPATLINETRPEGDNKPNSPSGVSISLPQCGLLQHTLSF